MTLCVNRWLVCCFVVLVTCQASASAQDVEFNRDIRPLFLDRCISCHGPDAKKREGELRLDDEESAKKDSIVPGDPGKSDLIQRLTHADPDERMPPDDSGKKLSDEEIALLSRWVEQGAKYEPFWAFVPPHRHALPKLKAGTKIGNWVDAFILDKLARESQKPSPSADRVTLMRRLSFDLTGLPPTPSEVDSFVKDSSDDAYEKVVDRLLASDGFGERMAMYWLDLVRYADTVGYHGDQDHSISPYRDYVIDAFDRNLPFDQFTREQLAGDLLPNATIDQKVATGYNRLLQTSHEGGVQVAEYLSIYAADRVRNVSGVWMGLTLGCCQCHDHKSDPLTTKDFYSLVAFFADVDESQHFKKGSNSLPTNRPPEISVLSRLQREKIALLEEKIASVATDEQKQIQSEIKAIQSTARKTMVTVSIDPRTIRILPRGNWLDETGPIMKPAVPASLGKVNSKAERATRLDLAQWLVDPKQGKGGLTARVFANRFWYLLMGSGITTTMDDFGGQGELPTHPELLDNLAMEFMDNDWDVKHLLKTIAMSNTYRQSSMATSEMLTRDPANRLYARQARFRLPAEMVRDQALAVSGLLVVEQGGASIKPYQPARYYQHLNFPTRSYKHDTGEGQWRRGVYMHWQRQFLHPMLKAFDAPSREECTVQRSNSNTPLAALALLNDPTFVESARVLAARVLHEGGKTDAERIGLVYQLAVSRSPDDVEQTLLLKLLKESRQQYQKDNASAQKLVGTGQAPAAKDVELVELAAWTSVARAVMNLNETITRN